MKEGFNWTCRAWLLGREPIATPAVKCAVKRLLWVASLSRACRTRQRETSVGLPLARGRARRRSVSWKAGASPLRDAWAVPQEVGLLAGLERGAESSTL